jgi:UPF0755 protein
MKKKTKVFIYIISVLLTVAIFSFAAIYAVNEVFALSKSGAEKAFSLETECTVSECAERLKEEGIISCPFLFRIYFSLKSEKRAFPAGEYILSPAMSYDEIRYELFGIGKERTQVRVTVPEGYTTDEIIELFLENGIGTREGFENAIENGNFDFAFVAAIPEKKGRKYRLDGYLFPDTYMFFSDSGEEEVIAKMLANFERKFTGTMAEDASRAGFSVDEIVTLASMVQREAYYLSDMAGIASVFRNRLRGGMKYLQSDATALYGEGYDTYENTGLPPGAICNPGEDALRASVYPANTKYYYFFTGKDKKAVFSRTYSDHKRQIANKLK